MRTSAGRLIVLASVLVVACGKADKPLPVDTAAVARDTTAVVAGQYTLADFQRLRWLDGRWRGFMSDGKTFYEQYRFLDDSTIEKHAFPDSTFTKASSSSRVQLRGGTVADESASARWVATRIDSMAVDFAPHHGATNHFTWARETPTQWNATLRWTDKDGVPQSVVYALHRFGR